MSGVSLRLPDSLHRSIKKLAKEENVSVNQLITLAVAEKVSALMASDYLEKRGNRGSKKRFLEILAKARDGDPLPGDQR